MALSIAHLAQNHTHSPLLSENIFFSPELHCLRRGVTGASPQLCWPTSRPALQPAAHACAIHFNQFFKVRTFQCTHWLPPATKPGTTNCPVYYIASILFLQLSKKYEEGTCSGQITNALALSLNWPVGLYFRCFKSRFSIILKHLGLTKCQQWRIWAVPADSHAPLFFLFLFFFVFVTQTNVCST